MAEVQAPRRSPRFQIDPALAPVLSLRLLGTATRLPIDEVVDLSTGGIRFLIKNSIQLKVDVDILIIVSGYKLKFIGQIQRCQKGADGRHDIFAAFVTISEKNLRKLFSFLKSS